MENKNKNKTQTIYCIRHGKSKHNVEYEKEGEEAYMKQSNYDTELIPEGIQQAKDLQKWVSNTPIDYVIVSPLTRAIQTAQHMFTNPLSSSTHLIHQLHLYDEVTEYPNGVHTPNKRKPVTQLKSLYPTLDYAHMHSNEPTWDDTKEETESELAQRIQSFMMYISKLPYKNIVIISHSSYLHALLTYNLGELDYDPYISYCKPYVIAHTVVKKDAMHP